MDKTFKIIGMHCAGCAGKLESAVSQLTELKSAQVNLLTNQLIVEWDNNQYSPDVIDELVIQTVEKAGFSVDIPSLMVDSAWEEPTESDSAVSPSVDSTGNGSLFWSILSLIGLMYISMGAMFCLPLPGWLAIPWVNGWIQFHFLLPILYFNRGFFTSGFRALWAKNPNMDTLIALGATASIIYSLFTTLILLLHPAESRIFHGFYFESAAMILTIVALGRYLESNVKRKTTSALESLLELIPPTAHREQNGECIDIPVAEIKKGDCLIVKPGELIPTDGTVLDGDTSVDQSSLTGESMPIDKTASDDVFAGTMNQSGTIRIIAQRVGTDTTIWQIVRLMESTAAGKAPLSRIADAVCKIFVPTVLILSLLTFVGWLIAGQTLEFSLTCAISVLVISCPCALGLATPTAIMVGTGWAARKGILFKSASALENLQKVNTVVFDKTGTITQGKPSVGAVYSFRFSENELLAAVASLESRSEHPIAAAILDKAAERHLLLMHPVNFQSIPGQGIQGDCFNAHWTVGNRRFMQNNNVILPDSADQLVKECAELGNTSLLIAANGELVGIIAVADCVKIGSPQAVEMLKQSGRTVILLTGDNIQTADSIAKQVGIDSVLADVLPEQKAKAIANLQQQGNYVAMVGDGVNDAVALVQANIGIAIGTGTDIARESAQVVIQTGDLRAVDTAIRLSSAVVINIKENLFWAFIYNIIGIPVAMGIFYPVWGWTLSPMLAAAGMSLSSICVVLNALRLKNTMI